MHKYHRVMMLTLAGMAAAILPFIKRKMARPPSNEDNKVDGDEETSSSDETYEVFLSFRGKDNRKDFTDHLYKGLVNVGVRVFRDDEALRIGEEIGPELDKAIKDSKISIPIISPNYASSKWCLQELVHILECKKTAGQVVLPIFYRVDPWSVRHQIGTFETAFHSHKKKYGSNSLVVQKWRSALTEVASLKGWESSKTKNGHEGELVEIVVTKVLNELRKATLVVTDCLIGIEDRKKKILEMVEGKKSSDAQAIVIHGMGGIGKTTLAKVVYNQLSTKFKYCIFQPNIREKLTEQKCRPEDLQKQLISGILGQQWEIPHVDEGINIIKDRLKQKEVLILFDDVDHSDQLNALAKERSWFKSGSILIITTRNKDVLNTWEEGRLTYELNGLDPSLSFLLFCRHAFRRDDCPLMELHAIAEGIVSTTGGLPLAIEVIGSMLLGKSKVYWEGVFKKLQKTPNKDVQKQLRITYDALEYEQKQIFLDIACLSMQKRINFAFYMWDDCELFPGEGIEKLISLSLIKRGQENEVIIHDQLRDLGRAIIREEGNAELGNRSRLWDEEEALEVMQRNQGTAEILALNLSLDDYKEVPEEDRNFTSEQFKHMRKLRFLRLRSANLVGDFKNVLLDLRWLQWDGLFSGVSLDSPLVTLPTNFRPTKLVVLEFVGISITEQWEGWAQIQLGKKLKVLKLESLFRLTSTPDFSAFEKLEILILRNCRSLTKIHPSICKLDKTLLTLDVSGCPHLEKLPNEMGEMEELRQLLVDGTSIRNIPISKGYMTKLENLSAVGCEDLQRLPASIGSLINLVSLSLDECEHLQHLPDSIGSLKNLVSLSLDGCDHLQHLPDSIGSLINLVSLSLDGCDHLQHLPDSIGSLINLVSLSLDGCDHLQHLPDSIGSLINLVSLSLDECEHLQHLPDSIGSLINLVSLSLDECEHLQHLPDSIGSLKNLVSLSLDGCEHLQHIPDSIGSVINLVSLSLDRCDHLQHLPDSIGSLINLVSLSLDHCKSLKKLPESIGNLKSVTKLDISWTSIKTLPATIGQLRNLQHFTTNYISELTEVPEEIGELCSLQTLHLSGCPNLKSMPNLPCSLTSLNFSGGSMETLPNLSDLCNLKDLCYYDNFERWNRVLNFGSLNNLMSLKIYGSSSPDSSIENIEFILELPSSLKELHLSECPTLQALPSLSRCKMLSSLEIISCQNLSELGEIGDAVTYCTLRGCNALNRLPNLLSAKNLESLVVERCENLMEIQGLDGAECLKKLQIHDCPSLKRAGDLSCLKMLTELELFNCEKLDDFDEIEKLQSLQKLKIVGCKPKTRSLDLSLFTSLKEVYIKNCEKLIEIKSLQRQKNLKILNISCCHSLHILPDISLFTSLQEVEIDGCEKLREIRGLQGYKNLKKLKIS